MNSEFQYEFSVFWHFLLTFNLNQYDKTEFLKKKEKDK